MSKKENKEVKKEIKTEIKTETNKLNKFKTEKDLTITPIFLVGMLHLGDRINEVIPTDPFIPAIVELTMKHVTNIETTDDQIFITFDNKEFEDVAYFEPFYLKEFIAGKPKGN